MILFICLSLFNFICELLDYYVYVLETGEICLGSWINYFDDVIEVFDLIIIGLRAVEFEFFFYCY